MKATFYETRSFSEDREDFLSDTEYAQLQIDLMADPDRGDVIPGCGGLRKLRQAHPSRGKGKRSGARVIYLHVPDAKCFYFVGIYGKNEMDDFPANIKKRMKLLVQTIQSQVIANYQAWLARNDHEKAT